MTQQIINIGTGPDSYTGDNLRTAFQKINDNFSQLYAGNVGGNILAGAITSNSYTSSGNLTAGNITALTTLVSQGNVSGAYFIGNGSQLTGITASANLGNLIITGANAQTIEGTANASISFKPFAGRSVLLSLNTTANVPVNVSIASFTNSTALISTDGNLSVLGSNLNILSRSNLVISANSNPGVNNTGLININYLNGHMGFNTYADGYDFTFNGDIFANAFYAAENDTTGYAFSTPQGLTGINHIYQNDVNGNVSLVRISHDNATPAKFYENNHTILSGNLVVSQTGNTFAGPFSNGFIEVFSNANTYTQFVSKNINSGSSASSDIVPTADNGNDSAYFGDFGIASSTYAFAGYGLIKPNDVYLLAVGNNITGPGSSGKTNLVVGSTTGNISFFVGAPEDANVIMTTSSSGLNLNQGNLVVSMGNAPATATDPGQAGQLAWDGNYVYVCVATNVWKRANLSAW